MVKRVLTSIITLAVLMGSVVACSGSDSEVAELRAELEELKKDQSATEEAPVNPESVLGENCIPNDDRRIEDLFYTQVELVNGFSTQITSLLSKELSGDSSPQETVENFRSFLDEKYSEVEQAFDNILSNDEQIPFCDRGVFVLIIDQAQAWSSWQSIVNAGVPENLEKFKASEVGFANSSCALSNKLNFTVPAYLQSISNLC